LWPIYAHVIILSMKVSQIGEFGLIDLLSKIADRGRDKRLDSWQQLIVGIGDDAAAWQGDASVQLATVDSLVQDVHFSLATISWEDLGWKAMAVNLSDMAAMGGAPRYALVSLALMADTEVDDAAALYRGMTSLAQPNGVAVIGGDVSQAPLVVITITVLGEAGSQGGLLTRAAARPGDQIAVTGYLGEAAAGLKMLTQGIEYDAEITDRLRGAFLRPCPRLVEGQILVEQGVRAAIDISDGLVADLSHICQQSQVGARIETGLVPVHPAVKDRLGNKAVEMALSGGEDYELLFTASDEVINRVKHALTCPVSVIGETTADNAGKVTVIDATGNTISPAKQGWEHFLP
jgi:thiamine-monophosphate kinase